MPRPPMKRRRQNSFTQKRSQRVQIPDQTQARQALEARLSKKPLAKKHGDSDDSDNLVTAATSGRNRKRQEIFASGAVAKGDKPGANPTRAQRSRRVREDTEEILSQRSRSRSVSRAGSVASGEGTPAVSGSEKENEPKKKAQEQSNTSAKRRKLNDSQTTVNGGSQTPQPELSVLGKIKPRKRQASILQLIENEGGDSSSINSDDEREFLPDEVSTPVIKAPPTRVSSAQLDNTSSLKRKRALDSAETTQQARSPPVAKPSKSRQPERRRQTQEQIAQPTRSQQKRLNVAQQEEDDIMRPPESSDDDEPAVHQSTQSPRISKKQQPVVPSTEQLQSLMPSKKHKSQRQRKQDEFDIPDDSASAMSEDENDVSAFLPNRRKTAQKRQSTKQEAKKGAASGPGAKTRNKIKETKSTNIHTPSPARLRTPRPLGSTQAKSPSKQDPNTTTAMREKTVNTPLANKNSSTTTKGAKGKKQYGGSRLRGTGEENQVVSLLDEPSMGGEKMPETAETKAWKKKWADIDDFALEFEDTSVSTRSDSPNAR